MPDKMLLIIIIFKCQSSGNKLCVYIDVRSGNMKSWANQNIYIQVITLGATMMVVAICDTNSETYICVMCAV